MRTISKIQLLLSTQAALESAVVGLTNLIDLKHHDCLLLKKHPLPCKELDFCVMQDAKKRLEKAQAVLALAERATKQGDQTMAKKHFIALADTVKDWQECAKRGACDPFTEGQLTVLAGFCEEQNPRFIRSRWLGYIAGTNGKNGGKVKI